MQYTDSNWTFVYAIYALRQIQGDVCAMCGKSARLAIDHCHRSGEVRGLLCYSCNIAAQRHELHLWPIHSDDVARYVADPPGAQLGTPTAADRAALAEVIADQPWARPYHVTRVITAELRRFRRR